MTEPPELAGASKRARLAWWYEQDAAYGDRPAVAAAAKRLAPVVGLSEGTARAYIGADPRRPGEGRRGVMMLFAALGLVLVLAVLFVRFTAFSGDRIRAIRWRIRLRMHPGPGFASFGELWFRWSRHAAISHGRRARPGLRLRHRVRSRTTDYAVRLGRGQWFRRAYARMEDQVLVMAAQRTGKSGIVADRILDHPGPVLATSTRADLYESTAGARALRGPVHVFNPQGVGGVPSSLAWDLLGPCKDLVMARRMASWLKVPGIGGDLQWFQQKGDVALMALLWAAAVTGRTILDVYEWVQLHGHAKCLEILAGHPGSTRQMFAVAKRMFEENRTSRQHPRHDRPHAVLGDPARPRRGGHPAAG